MTDPDDLAELLRPPSGFPVDGVRDAVYRQTDAIVRGRGRVRRLARVAATIGIFTAGGLAGWLGRSPAVGPVREVVTRSVVVVVPVVGESAAVTLASLPTAPRYLPPERLELQAEQADDPAEAARLYQLAGDGFLNDREDYHHALRCYRLAVAQGGEAMLTPMAGDSWLLTRVKNQTWKEKYHASALVP